MCYLFVSLLWNPAHRLLSARLSYKQYRGDHKAKCSGTGNFARYKLRLSRNVGQLEAMDRKLSETRTSSQVIAKFGTNITLLDAQRIRWSEREAGLAKRLFHNTLRFYGKVFKDVEGGGLGLRRLLPHSNFIFQSKIIRAKYRIRRKIRGSDVSLL